jgi:hypothetical protein
MAGNSTFVPWFPEANSYIKSFDYATKSYRYRQLLWKREGMKYPKRLAALSAGSKGDSFTFDEINPSLTKKHIYLAYLGVCPGFQFFLWHPYDVKNLKWDETIQDITEDMVANITYEESPYEYPTKMIGIERDRYPAVQAKNISGETKTPEIIWVAALYVVREHEELKPEELEKLESGALKSHPMDFGGEL